MSFTALADEAGRMAMLLLAEAAEVDQRRMALSRYALVWYLLPTYVGVWGVVRWLSRRWLLPYALDRVLVAAVLCVNALLATWLLPELPVDDFAKSFKSEIVKLDKALEAAVVDAELNPIGAIHARATRQTLVTSTSAPETAIHSQA